MLRLSNDLRSYAGNRLRTIGHGGEGGSQAGMAADWLNNRVASILVKVRVSENEKTVLARSGMRSTA